MTLTAQRQRRPFLTLMHVMAIAAGVIGTLLGPSPYDMAYAPAFGFDEVALSHQHLKGLHDSAMSSATSPTQLSKKILVPWAGSSHSIASPAHTYGTNISGADTVNGARYIEISAQTAHLNDLNLQANYDFQTNAYGRPFLNAELDFYNGGIGDESIAHIPEFSNFTSDSQRRNISIEAGGGLQIPLDNDVAFTGAYRYFDTEGTDLEAADLDYTAHEFRIGFKFKLPATAPYDTGVLSE